MSFEVLVAYYLGVSAIGFAGFIYRLYTTGGKDERMVTILGIIGAPYVAVFAITMELLELNEA